MSPTNEMGQGHGALSAAAGRVADARHDFDRLDDELVQHLDAARSTWSGQGGSAFHALGRAWAERQLTITRALDDFEASLRATEHDNTGTDDTQSAAFLRVQQRLG
jgi:WXG100 family type VII secretion target